MMQVTDEMVRLAVGAMRDAENRWKTETSYLNLTVSIPCPDEVRARAAITAALAAMWQPAHRYKTGGNDYAQARPHEELEDGRFEAIPPPPQAKE